MFKKHSNTRVLNEYKRIYFQAFKTQKSAQKTLLTFKKQTQESKLDKKIDFQPLKTEGSAR